MADRERITIAVLGLGGQGGGVLADWIVQLGERGGHATQGTSVPGVAQRTGATIYYIEMIPAGGAAPPVLALTPVPGDVDIVLASELMEAGRAILRGFVTKRTELIGSTHRVYAIAEKSAMGDGRAGAERIVAAAGERSKRFIGFDMDAVAERTGSVISSVLFGALAGSGALPFPRIAFEDAIRAGGKAVEANLRGFAAGFDAAQGKPEPQDEDVRTIIPTTDAGRALAARIEADLPCEARLLALEGVRRLMDYQDAAYARLYLDRLDSLGSNAELIAEAARHLALWMSYEDTIRVADLKVRASRFARVRGEVRAKDDQIVQLTEYMHPRLEEVCETLPAGIGGRLLASKRWSRRLAPLFARGRHVETTSLRWFLALSLLAGWRRWRRGTLRYQVEQARIEDWLSLIRASDTDAAIELVRCQRLIKGYAETFERGLGNYARIVERYRAGGLDAAGLRRLREAALADEEGAALGAALAS
ncbi:MULTISPECIES: indolepyruvate oxidoreductase subunit beta family protein [unclassified Sphingomonas]|uniref:indolepyruvate oxidoreductase subunit beta family protein n=1 Tax=Sphingomonas TaxID=13687 RepID=UPI00095EA948|nr:MULTISPECIES: indolepyruvate oxidoreductase subunit beta family protein [unclassified Sphingomonas]MBN8813315.1 indolepyruvate oxidoreductase subunit beta family protein [Sphingomonas sp.]OJY53295.1 MAG: indolepyruvate oxidoreductase subunit B [Sphingomonas sp. 67-41]